MYSEQQAQNCCGVLPSGLHQWFWRVLPHHVKHTISLMPGLLTICSLSGQTQYLHYEGAGERITDWQLSKKNKSLKTSLLPLQGWPAPHDF